MSDKQADAVTADPGQSASTPPDMSSSPLIELMQIKIVQAAPELVIGTMPVEGNTQPYGLLHGGASCVLAETLGSVGAALHGALTGMIAVGLDINATHHRGPRSGLVTGTARAIHLGGRVANYEIQIVDDQERRICTARLTCMLLSAS
jgi:uncharacterized protein (TIGR00369 family)